MSLVHSGASAVIPTEQTDKPVIASDDWAMPREITVAITLAGSEARSQEDTLSALLMALHLQDKVIAWSDFDEMPRPLYEWMAERELLSHDDMDWNEVIEALDNHENELIAGGADD